MDKMNIGGGPSGVMSQKSGAMMDPMQNQMFGGSIAEPTIQPQQNPVTVMDGPTPATDDEPLDAEFLQEIETYLKECMENNELSIDMSDTLIADHGAKMVAAAASLCDQL